MGRITFGTDGWRGVIADDFTTENLSIVTQAVMSCLKRTGGPDLLCIGYDTRFMSSYFARHAASVAAANGYSVLMSRNPVTTPMLSHAACSRKTSGGLMVTASHNPYNYNGLKFKPPFGGSAGKRMTAEIESLIGAGPASFMPYDRAKTSGMVVEADFFGLYSKDVYAAIDRKFFGGTGPEAVFDCMHGATGPHAGRLWDGLGLDVKTLRDGRDPYFGGGAPEPVEPNLAMLANEVVEGGYPVGLAADGDGDRLAVLDSSGRFVGAHVVMGLLIKHLVKQRCMTGMVVRTVSTSTLVDRVAADLGLPVVETPVGFKHICELMRKKDVLIGGEENGGIGVKGFIPERDGLLAALLVLETLAAEGADMSELVRRMDESYGKLYHKRYDLRLKKPMSLEGFVSLGNRLEEIFGDFGVEGVSRVDGFKLHLRGGSWLLLRRSGTEPLVRVYAESEDQAVVDRLVQRAKEALVG